MTEEKRYTLAEAKRELALQECHNQGHAWIVMETFKRPLKVTCEVCGKSYNVEEPK